MSRPFSCSSTIRNLAELQLSSCASRCCALVQDKPSRSVVTSCRRTAFFPFWRSRTSQLAAGSRQLSPPGADFVERGAERPLGERTVVVEALDDLGRREHLLARLAGLHLLSNVLEQRDQVAAVIHEIGPATGDRA